MTGNIDFFGKRKILIYLCQVGPKLPSSRVKKETGDSR